METRDGRFEGHGWQEVMQGLSSEGAGHSELESCCKG